MRLKWKLSIGFFALIIFAMIVNVVVVASIFLPDFRRLDERTARENGARAHEFLQTDIDSLRSATRDWAQRDDTYRFASDLDKDYQARNLKPEDLKTLGVDGYTITDNDGNVIFRKSSDPALASLFEVGKPLPAGMFAQVPAKDGETNSVEGVVATPLGPILVSIGPILTSNYEGPQRGYLVFSRLLAPRAKARIHDKGLLDFSLTPASSSQLAKASPDGHDRSQDLIVADKTLTANYTLRDVTGRPSYVLHVSTPREFNNIGTIALGGAVIRFVGFAIIFWAIVTWLTGRTIVKPLSELAEKMAQIASTGELDRTLDIKRSDEIGWVADVFNRMIRELRTLRSRQIEKSYVTGMADLSAGILNNIRSALKPVIDANHSASELVERFDTATLAEAGRDLAHGNIENDQRQKLGNYIAAFTEGTRIRMSDLKRQLHRIDESAQHIQNILEDHESISKWPRQSAPVDCRRLVEETSRGVTCVDDVPIDLEISHASADLPPVLGHAFILRQVVGNLLANSIDAIHRAQRKRGRIHILTRRADLSGIPMVEIVVGDNGAGFTGMQAEKLFERGYSARSDRPGGFGLHWCRTTLAAMNASIVGQSPGPGLGATFRIFLPAAPQAMIEAKPSDAAPLQGVA